MFLDVLMNFDNVWYGYVGRINFSKHHICLFVDNMIRAQSALCVPVPIESQFTAVEMSLLFAESFVEPLDIEWTS